MIDLTKITTPFGLLDAETQEALKAHGGRMMFGALMDGYRQNGRPLLVLAYTASGPPRPSPASVGPMTRISSTPRPRQSHSGKPSQIPIPAMDMNLTRSLNGSRFCHDA